MSEGQDLGPAAAMQIRSVPEKVRSFFNRLAYDEGEITLGELMTRIATGATVVHTTVDGQPVSAVQTAIAANMAPSRLPALAQAAQALAHVAQASGVPIPKRTAASLNAAIAAEVRMMRGLSAPHRQIALPAPDSGS